jgi:hypothetical protein
MPENAMRRRHLHDHLVRSTGPCPERAGLDQSTPAGMRPAQQMCTQCGRVTARRHPSGLPWCGGTPVTPAGRTVEIWPATWLPGHGPLAA